MSAGIEGLLHLTSVGLLLTVGYVGLDRVRTNPSSFSEQLGHAKSEARKLLKVTLDIAETESPITLKPWYDSREVYLLCFVAEIPVDVTSWRRVGHFLYRQWRLPLFGYYRRRQDKIVVSIFTLVEVLTFLTLCASTLWEISFVREVSVQWGIYAYSTIMILWIFCTVAYSYSLSPGHLGSVCERIAENAKRRVDGLIPAMDLAVKAAEARLAEQIGTPVSDRPAADHVTS